MKRFSIAMLLVATLASAVLAQSETAVWIAWTRANHFPIASVVSMPQDDFADLRFFKDVIGERRLLQLGESGHGVGQFDSAKVRLIKFFHEQMGFDVIAFESSIYECFAANTNATNAVDMLQRSIFTVWASEEVLPLFDYIQATQRTDHPLLLAGFDTQISSARASPTDRHSFAASSRRLTAATPTKWRRSTRRSSPGHEAIPRSGTSPKRSTIVSMGFSASTATSSSTHSPPTRRL
jgi:erythromycin esterase-like protein